MTLSHKIGEKAEAQYALKAVCKADENREAGPIHKKGV